MPTIERSTTRYFRVIGSRRTEDGKVRHVLEEVADYTGAAMPPGRPRSEETIDVAPAQRQPDDTIVKVVDTITRTFTISPTS